MGRWPVSSRRRRRRLNPGPTPGMVENWRGDTCGRQTLDFGRLKGRRPGPPDRLRGRGYRTLAGDQEASVERLISGAQSTEVDTAALPMTTMESSVQFGRHVAVQRGDKTRSYRCHLDRWLGEAMCIEGLPIPDGALNASPHIERSIGPFGRKP